MKKSVSALILVLASGALSYAQTMEDAILISSNNYSGSAKTIGLANAVTALGGDLGTIGINPAGSAVAGYSQFTITPSYAISSTNSAYAPSYRILWNDPSASETQTFGISNKESKMRFTMPDIGFTLRFDSGRKYGLKSYTFGFVSNQTAQFNYSSSAGGNNSLSTMSGCLASYATADGLPAKVLSFDNRYGSQFNWNEVVAYHGGLINYNDDAGSYFGSAENVSFDGTRYSYGLKGTLFQNSSIVKSGSKNDILINLGFNFNDNLFIGTNLGLPIMKYRYDEYYSEAAASDPSDFIVSPEYYGSDGKYHKASPTNFRSASYEYVYTSDIDGIYLSLGAIWLPVNNLRLGASFRTPTLYTITETYQSFVNTGFAYGVENAYTELGEYKYCLRSPYVFDFGAAYTFGPLGLISVDYEVNDFSVMEYSTLYENANKSSSSIFDKVNKINSRFCGASRSLRIGAEVKLLPQLAVRAGYSFVTDPRRHCTDNLGNVVDASWYDNYFQDYEGGVIRLNDDWKYSSDKVRAFSLGLGYVSGNAFFADFAVRMTSYPEKNFCPYGCYIDNEDVTVMAPTLRTNPKLFDVALTLGWRF